MKSTETAKLRDNAGESERRRRKSHPRRQSPPPLCVQHELPSGGSSRSEVGRKETLKCEKDEGNKHASKGGRYC